MRQIVVAGWPKNHLVKDRWTVQRWQLNLNVRHQHRRPLAKFDFWDRVFRVVRRNDAPLRFLHKGRVLDHGQHLQQITSKFF